MWFLEIKLQSKFCAQWNVKLLQLYFRSIKSLKQSYLFVIKFNFLNSLVFFFWCCNFLLFYSLTKKQHNDENQEIMSFCTNLEQTTAHSMIKCNKPHSHAKSLPTTKKWNEMMCDLCVCVLPYSIRTNFHTYILSPYLSKKSLMAHNAIQIMERKQKLSTMIAFGEKSR